MMSPTEKTDSRARPPITRPPKKPTFSSYPATSHHYLLLRAAYHRVAPPFRPPCGIRPAACRCAIVARRFRPDSAGPQRPHEHVLVYRLPGVIEHQRDAGVEPPSSEALPGTDDHERGRFLIAQNRHAECLASGGGFHLRLTVLRRRVFSRRRSRRC